MGKRTFRLAIGDADGRWPGPRAQRAAGERWRQLGAAATMKVLGDKGEEEKSIEHWLKSSRFIARIPTLRTSGRKNSNLSTSAEGGRRSEDEVTRVGCRRSVLVAPMDIERVSVRPGRGRA